MISQSELAAQIALRQALHHRGLASKASRESDRVALNTTYKQLLKAAAELKKGNVPLDIEIDGQTLYLVESRSNYIGKLVELQVSGNVFSHIQAIVLDVLSRVLSDKNAVPDGDVTLKFTVTSGDVWLVNPVTMLCGCERGTQGCWHFAMVDCWIQAGNELAGVIEDALGEKKEPAPATEIEIDYF